MLHFLVLIGSESFDIVLGAAPSGLGALRLVVRRWDRPSGGKRTAVLRQILIPDRCNLQDLPVGLEKWEALLRRYERSKSSATRTATLDEDCEIAALEALVLSELEQHLHINRPRLITYEQFPIEIREYTEAHRSQFAFKTVAAKNSSDPMDVDSFGKGGKKSKKGEGDSKNGKKEGEDQNQSQNPNPNNEVVCWVCCEKGHLCTECWSNPQNQSASGGGQYHGGKGKPKNSTGKGAGSLEQGDEAAAVEQQRQLALASSLDMALFETLGRSPHPDSEGWWKERLNMGME